MASRLGSALSGAIPGLLPVNRCVIALEALRSEAQHHEQSLPLAPTEPPFVVLTCDGDRVGDIFAPSYPPASSFSHSCLQKRVNAGHAAAFVLAPPADVFYGDLNATMLATLAALVQVSAELQQPADLCVAPAQLPAAYEVLMAHGGVLVTVPFPTAPEGSRVVISRISVAGCDVALGEAPLEVIVGFNHAPAPKGVVWDASAAGDAPALTRLLHGGASTEEKNDVSGRTWQRLPHPCAAECRLSLSPFPASPCHTCHAPLAPPRTPAPPTLLPPFRLRARL
jgi:hypothetical protein